MDRTKSRESLRVKEVSCVLRKSLDRDGKSGRTQGRYEEQNANRVTHDLTTLDRHDKGRSYGDEDKYGSGTQKTETDGWGISKKF